MLETHSFRRTWAAFWSGLEVDGSSGESAARLLKRDDTLTNDFKWNLAASLRVLLQDVSLMNLFCLGILSPALTAVCLWKPRRGLSGSS